MQLNIMMTFAQFEREVIGERIRDKLPLRAKRAFGWAGGHRSATRSKIASSSSTLADAATVRSIFKRFCDPQIGHCSWPMNSGRINVRNRYGQAIDKGVLYKLLKNRTYVGDAVHKGAAIPRRT